MLILCGFRAEFSRVVSLLSVFNMSGYLSFLLWDLGFGYTKIVRLKGK